MKLKLILKAGAYISLIALAYGLGRGQATNKVHSPTVNPSLTEGSSSSNGSRTIPAGQRRVWVEGGSIALDSVSDYEGFQDAVSHKGITEEKLITCLFETDWQTALRLIEGIDDVGRQVRLVNALLLRCPADLFTRLKHWVLQQDPAVVEGVRRQLVKRWFIEDKSGLLKAIDEISDENEAAELRSAVFEFLPVSQQLSQIGELPGNESAELLIEQMEGLSTLAPDQTLDTILRNFPTEAGKEAIAALFNHWAGSDPVGAARAALRIDDAELAFDALYELAFKWSSIDSYRASMWVKSLPYDTNRDAAAAGLASELSEEQPDMAFAWANAISNHELRRKALEASYRRWAQIDPAAAANALQQSNLPEQEREQLYRN